MNLTRRTFLKTSAAAGGGALVVGSAVEQGLETLAAGSAASQAAPVEDFVSSACWIGKQDCGIVARRVDGRVVKIEGNKEHPRNLGSLCPKGVAQVTTLYDPGRITTPLIRTNPKGGPGQWRQASWDEALGVVAEKLKAAIAKDKRLAAYVPGRTKVGGIYDGAFRGATGITASYGRRGNDCGGAAEDATLATWGMRTPIAPDLARCNYLICYWGLTTSGGPGLCQITYPKQVADAKARGMKVVSISPYARPVAHFADEWVPIKPGTDMAFWLAAIHVLLKNGFVDQEFLKASTNAPSLVRDDGSVLSEGGKDLAWDSRTSRAVPYGPGVDPALTGQFQVGGVTVKPAFQVLQDHVQRYTPDWAAGVSGVPAGQIERIARALGENARIGSTTVIDGVEVPYRPVAYGMHGSATKFHSSIQTNRAILLAFMILGAFEAAGGPHLWEHAVSDPSKAHAGWLAAVKKETADRIDLGGTKWFPLGSSGYHMFPNAFAEPDRYKLPVRAEDMAVIVDYLNPIMTARPISKQLATWKRFGFVAIVTPDLSATADYVADLILPCGTLDKWEGPLSARTLYQSGDTVRAPLMAPLGQSKGELEIYTDLAEKMGKLVGKDGFIDRVNQALSLKEQYRLPLDRKPSPEQILEAWSRSKHGISLAELGRKGVVSAAIPAAKQHMRAEKPAFGGVRGHFYVEAFGTLRSAMRGGGVQESLWTHYAPYPAWFEPAIEKSPADFDLYLMDYKRMEHKQTRSTSNPLLNELVPLNPLVMHTGAAAKRGLKDGDPVRIESHNPVTGETSSVQTTLATVDGIRPDTVALTHHVSRPDQPSVNALFFYGDGFWDMGAGWYSHVKVRVSKAGGPIAMTQPNGGRDA